MHLHKTVCFAPQTAWRTVYAIWDKKRLRRQNAPKAQRKAKKERDIRPRYCTAPSRVFSNK